MVTRRLGRGLEGLISGSAVSSTGEEIVELRIGSLVPNPFQPRRDFDSSRARAALEDLARSIQKKGVIQPVTVRERDGRYELIAGERRWRAAKEAGLETVPARLRSVSTDAEMMEYALIENLQREDLNAMEEAEAYAVLSGRHGLSHEAIAEEVGKSRVAVTNSLRLLKLPPRIQQGVRDGAISAGHARALLGLTHAALMDRLYDRIVRRGESVRFAEETVGRLNAAANRRKDRVTNVPREKSADLAKVERDLFDLLSAKVTVKARSKGGTIQIDYFDNDDLNRILELLGRLAA